MIGGMYNLYHKWMQYEADEALRMGKPIIAIMPRGGVYMPVELQAKATTQVGWSSVSIVNAIRALAWSHFIIFRFLLQAARRLAKTKARRAFPVGFI